METCPRCGGELTREDNEDVARKWRIDKDGVGIGRLLNYQLLEVIDFQKSEPVHPLHALVVFN